MKLGFPYRSLEAGNKTLAQASFIEMRAIFWSGIHS